ncbi:MAG: energy-coupling factor transporter transmembrane protein EcfT [Actinomycetaceae bacterium]|nr:energy-coupling factor transporter transmembrane protein EcfT [Actinomycetaceae bacterium]
MAYTFMDNTAKSGIHLDPRTKIAALIALSLFVMANAGGERLIVFYFLFALLPFFLFLSVGSYKRSFVYILILPSLYIVQLKILPLLESGVIQYLLLAVCGIVLRFVPTVAMAFYISSTMTVSEFVAGMNKLHISEKIIIPFTVIFRFIPTFLEEISSIWDAMRMRDIRLGGAKRAKMLEYLLVPSIMCTVRIADELSAAALARGLGGPVRRTNVCQLRFTIFDFLLLAIIGAAFLWWAIGVLPL